MPHDGYIAIGTVLNPHGYKGKLSVYLNFNKSKDFKFTEPIFVEIQQILVPFFVLSLTGANKKHIIELQNINSENEALKLKRKELLVSEKFFKSYIAEKEDKEIQLLNYQVCDNKFGNIGVIEKILKYPGHEIFLVRGLEKQEILIPYTNDFIEKIDKKNKIIHINTPEGLLDLYI